ncbi:MAG TPA: transglycosylase SLT domain-containing protein [Longimicrobiaceae bacterium]|nr:transglycosylase SLT domain-containing protein [Longimicrobiaceae bacterium]
MTDMQHTPPERSAGILDQALGRVRRSAPLRRWGAVLALGAMGTGMGVARAAENAHRRAPAAPLFAPDGVAVNAMVATTAPAGPDWDLPNLDHERVDFWVERFTTSKRGEFTRFLERSGRYVPMISAKLAERGMPQDLIYLAMIESGFNPSAYSPAAASGLWQFIEETGKRYGLAVNRAVDERNDPVKSTDAALDYLTELHERFGSWYLSAAAYNTGENRVARIMREETGSERGDEESYYRIWNRLPRETRDYVPLMIAAARIAKEPAKYGFDTVQPEAPMTYEEVVVDPGAPLDAVARAAGIPVKEVKDLNPQLTLDRTRNDRRSVIRVPEGTRTAFLVNWPRVREERTLAVTEYRVRYGDSLLAIARRHGVTAEQIRQENQIRGDRIRAGQTLRIPPASG